MKKYFISDTHFGHYNVINYSQRPFTLSTDENIPMPLRQKALVNEMNQFMIDKWNSVVSEEDLVYFIGDFAFLGIKEMKEILNKLKGRKVLIKGNHDRNAKQMLEVGFSEVHDQLTIDINGREVLLNHYPYVDMELYDAAKNRPQVIKFVKSEALVNPEIPTNLDYNEMKIWLSQILKKPINSQIDGAKELIIQIQKLVSKYIGSRPLNEGKILLHGHTHNKEKRFANMINCSVEAWNFVPASEEQILEQIIEYEKELSGEFLNEENCENSVYSYYNKLKRKLFKIKEFSDLGDLIHTYQLIKEQTPEKPFKTHFVPQKYSSKWYELNKKHKGFIPQENLEAGCFYKGSCRNASWSYWDGNKFFYIRYKFGNEFIEPIECLENDNGYDVFIPYEKINLTLEDQEKFDDMWKRYSLKK